MNFAKLQAVFYLDAYLDFCDRNEYEPNEPSSQENFANWCREGKEAHAEYLIQKREDDSFNDDDYF